MRKANGRPIARRRLNAAVSESRTKQAPEPEPAARLPIPLIMEPYVSIRLSKQERKDCELRFKAVRGGINSTAKLQALLYDCGQHMSQEELEEQLEAIDFHFGSRFGYLDLEVFLGLMQRLKKEYVERTTDPDNEILEAFLAVGGNADHSGLVDLSQLNTAMSQCGLPPAGELEDSRFDEEHAAALDFECFKRSLEPPIEQGPAEEEKTEEVAPVIEAESGSEEDGEEEPKPGANPWTRLKRACAATGMMTRGKDDLYNRQASTVSGDDHRRRTRAEIRLGNIMQNHTARLSSTPPLKHIPFPQTSIPELRQMVFGESQSVKSPTKPRGPSCLRKLEEQQRQFEAEVEARVHERLTKGSAGPRPATAFSSERRRQRPQSCQSVRTDASHGRVSALPRMQRPSSAVLPSFLDSTTLPPSSRLTSHHLTHSSISTFESLMADSEPSEAADVNWFLMTPNHPLQSGTPHFLLEDPRNSTGYFVYEGRLIQATPFAFVDVGEV